MNNLNEEDLVSADDISFAIEEFVGKHPENVNIWVDGETTTIQISNSGIRDKLFSRLAYLAENTTIENNLTIFNMPAKCVYTSNQIIRFTCTVNELVSTVDNFNNPPRDCDYDAVSELHNVLYETFPIKKFFSRLTKSGTLKKSSINYK